MGGSVLDGVRTRPIEVHRDARGSFAEYFVAHRDHGINPLQWSVVTSEAGVLRGMHLHNRHDEYFTLVSGHVTLGLHDIRPGSPTEGLAATYEWDENEPIQLIFPRGLVHGWLFHRPSAHLQATSEAYDHYSADDNSGCHWSDPGLAIDWPFEPSHVAERAEGFGTLEELRSVVRAPSEV